MKHLLAFFFLFAATAAICQVAENDDTFIISGTGFNGPVRAMAVQSDEKIVVAGDFTSYNGTTRNYIARLNADGTLDDAFDAGATFGSSVNVLAIDGQGRIVCSGSFFPSVKRLTSTGTNDGTFALTGTGLDGFVNTIAIAGDGTIYVGGGFFDYDGTGRNYIARLLADGGLDTNFDPGTGLDGIPRKIGIQSDGMIVVVGGSSGFSHYDGALRENIVRIQSTGEIDAGFVPPFNLHGKMYDVKFQSDDKIIVTGEYAQVSGSIFDGVERLNTDGSLDGTFNSSFFQGGRSLLIRPDGTIVIGILGLVKVINADGTNNAFFNGANLNKTTGDIEVTLAMQNGKILMAGDFTSFKGFARTNMARVTTCSSIEITTQPQNKTVCETNDASFSVVATGSGLTYQWQEKELPEPWIYTDMTDGGGITGTGTATLSISSASASIDARSFRCVISDGTCSTVSFSATIDVLTTPVVNIHPSPATVCNGTGASFQVAVTNPGSLQWQLDEGSGFVDFVDFGIFSGASTTTLTLQGVNPGLDGLKFRCRVGNCNPAIYSNEALLTVLLAPAVVSTDAQVTTCSGNNVQLTLSATNATDYQWQEKVPAGNFVDITDGGIYAGATTATLDLTGVTVTQHGNYYRCVVSGAGSCSANSFQRLLNVYAPPSVTSHPESETKCVGGSATFAITPGGLTTAMEFQWQEQIGVASFVNITDGVVFSGATTATLTVSGVTADMNGNKYRCVVGDCNTSVISNPADLVVEPPAVITQQPANFTACPEEDVTFSFTATGDNITYHWRLWPTVGAPSIIEDDLTYSGATTNTLTISVSNALSGNKYQGIATIGSCIDANTSLATLTVPQTPTITSQSGDKIVCAGGTTTMFASGNGSNVYQWEVDFTGLGYMDVVDGGVYSGATTSQLTISGATVSLDGNMYRCKVGACTPAESTPVTLTVNQPPTLTSNPVDRMLCVGENTTFEVTATGTSLSYKWRADGAEISDNAVYSGTQTQTLTLDNINDNALNDKVFTCDVSGAAGCTPVVSTGAKLTVQQISITTQPVAVAAFCDGGNASYSVIASATNLTYQWQLGTGANFITIVDEGVYTGATTATLTITGATSSMNSSKYRCVVSGDCPSATSNEVTLFVIQVPAKPVINADLSNPEAPMLTASVSAQAYKWYKNGTQVSDAIQFLTTGEGSYTVKASNSGCESELSDAKVIIVTGAQHRTESTVLVYPNPVVDALVVSLRDFDSRYNVDITLVDVLGRTMERTSGTGGQDKQIDVSRFAAGQYMIRLQQGQQHIMSQFIKKTH